MVVLLTTASLEGQHLAKSFFNTGLLGAAGSSGPSDDQFNRVSFLSHFEGSNNGVNNAFDDSSSSNHTIPAAAGNVTQGSFGPFAKPDGEWAVDFDSGGDYLTTPYSSDFNFGTGSFTVEAFVFLRDLSGIQGIYATSAGANPVPKWVMFLDDATPKIHINSLNSSGSIYMNATSGITVGTWNHIAFVRNGSTWYWFINGTQAGTGSNSTNITFSNSEPTYIGYGGESYFTAINGFISNLRVVNGTALYTSNFTVPTSALTAVTNTKLLTCQSNRFVDNSSNGHTITPSGNPAVTAFGPILTSAVYDPAVNGASAFVPSRTDIINIPSSSEFNMTGEFSVEFWVYLISNDAGGIDIMFRGYGSAGQNAQIGYEPSNRHLYLYNDANPVTSSTDMHIKSWNHIACCRTSSTTSIFLNGVRVGTNSSYSTAVDFGNAPVEFMAYGEGEYSPAGYATNLRLLKGSSAYDATASTLTVPTAPLTAITNTKLLLNMADAQAIDSAAQNNLTLYGNAKISTGQAKFGNTSLYLDGNDDYLVVNNHRAYGTGPFTIEMFFRLDSVSGSRCLYDDRPDGASGDYISLIIASGAVNFYVGTTLKVDAGSISANTFYHIALCRSGTDTKLFLDGTQIGSTFSSDTTNYLNTGILRVGTNRGYNNDLAGYIDDFRISHMARYTSNFTAPSEPFADKGQ